MGWCRGWKQIQLCRVFRGRWAREAWTQIHLSVVLGGPVFSFPVSQMPSGTQRAPTRVLPWKEQRLQLESESSVLAPAVTAPCMSSST